MLIPFPDPGGGIARAILGSGSNFPCSSRRHGHQCIIGFAIAHQQAFDAKRLNSLAIGGNNGHRSRARLHVEIAGRTSIDEPQANDFSGLPSQMLPTPSIDQECVIRHI